MTISLFKVLTGLFGIALIGAIGIHWSGAAERTEAILSVYVSEALQAEGLQWASIEIDGQKAIIGGAAPTDDEAEAALRTARAAAGPGGTVFGGITAVENHITLAFAQSSPLNSEESRSTDLTAAADQQATESTAEIENQFAGAESGRRIREERISACQSEINRLLREAPVRFESGSASVDAAQTATLDAIAETLMRCPNSEILVGGHSDATGELAENLRLSQLRADSVAAYLAGELEEGAPLRAVGYGEANPIASNDTAEGRSSNRRIEITLSLQAIKE